MEGRLIPEGTGTGDWGEGFNVAGTRTYAMS
jgi:hypothetical protein